jgi:hypothetical protein
MKSLRQLIREELAEAEWGSQEKKDYTFALYSERRAQYFVAVLHELDEQVENDKWLEEPMQGIYFDMWADIQGLAMYAERFDDNAAKHLAKAVVADIMIRYYG